MQSKVKTNLSAWIPSLKAATVSITPPFIILIIYLIYGKISALSVIYILSLSFIFALMLIRPYVNDLLALTEYVKQLANEEGPRTPYLTTLQNIENLSMAINTLNISWQKKHTYLESIIVENKVLLDSLPDILLILDGQLIVTQANKTALHTFKHQLYGRHIDEIVNNKLLPSFIKWVMHDKHSKNLELYLEDLRQYYMVRIEQFFNSATNEPSIIILMTDITEAKITEKMLSDFVANASHEIRTPLTSLKGFIELLQTTAQDDPDAQQQFLSIMASQVTRLSNLVSDLLSLAKLERDVYTVPSDKVNLQQILKTVTDETYGMRKDKNILIELHIDPDLPVITADQGQLIQLFTNLISNSVKYGHANSIITITTTYINETPAELSNLSMQEIKQLAVIAIQDKSDGIEPQHLPRLTERFYRIDESRTRKEQTTGSGIGLAIVKQIIARHQGELKIESELGKGSIFTVSLPVEQIH